MQAAAQDAARKWAALAECLHCGAPAQHPGPPVASTPGSRPAVQHRPVRSLRAPEAPLGLSGQGSAGFGEQGALACLGEAAVMLARLGLASCAALRPLAEQAVAVRAAAASACAHGSQQTGVGQGEVGGAGASGPDLPTTERVLEAAWARVPLLGQAAGGARAAHADPTSDPGSGMGACELLGLLLEEEAGALVAAAAAGEVPAAGAAFNAAAALGRLLDHASDPLATLYAPGEPQQARRRARALVLRARCIGTLSAAWPAPLPAEGNCLGLGFQWAAELAPADQAAVRDLAEAADLLEACAGADGAARRSAGATAGARAGNCSITGSLESAAARAELALAIAAATQRRTLAAGRDSDPPAGPTSHGCSDGRSPGAATAMDCSSERCGGGASCESRAKDCAASQDTDGSAADADAAWGAAAEQAGRAVAHWEAAHAAAASGSPTAATAEHGTDGGRSDAEGAGQPGQMEAASASWSSDGGEAAGGRPAASPAAAAQAAMELAMMLGAAGGAMRPRRMPQTRQIVCPASTRRVLASRAPHALDPAARLRTALLLSAQRENGLCWTRSSACSQGRGWKAAAPRGMIWRQCG